MTCEPCKSAGRALQEGRTQEATKLHNLCADPNTCTCQHRVEVNIINQERIGNASSKVRDSTAEDGSQ